VIAAHLVLSAWLGLASVEEQQCPPAIGRRGSDRQRLYAYPVFCTVYPLRHRGQLLRPGDAFFMSGRAGVLTVDRGLGTSEVHAVLADVETGDEVLRLYRARLVKIAAGGVLLAGDEVRFRGSKSKGEHFRQSWWCLPAPARPQARDATDG